MAVRTVDAVMPGWPDFAEEVFGGRQPSSRRSRLLEVLRSDVVLAPPRGRWRGNFACGGRSLSRSRLSPRATVVLTADDGRGPGPVAWAFRRPGGRVLCTTLGHEDDFREPAFLR